MRSDFLVVVNVQAAGIRDLRFILDTGATYTVIDRKLADKLHLSRRPGKITNFDRDAPVEWADLPEISVGPVYLEVLPVLVAKLSEYSEFAEGVDGILGLDVLGRSSKLFIDYEKQTVAWECQTKEGSGRHAPHYISAPLIVQGLPVHLILDTGFQGILLYKDRLRKGLPRLRTEGEAVEVDLGRLQTTRVKLPGVRLLGEETSAMVYLMDGPPAGDPPGVDGYLGIASLNAKRVEFDFADNVLRWQ